MPNRNGLKMKKVIVVGDFIHFVGATGNIASAFESLGWEVIKFNTSTGYCCYKSMNEALINSSIEYQPKLILFVKNHDIHYSTLQIIKKHCACLLASWWIDDPLVCFGRDELAVNQFSYDSIRFFDHFFVFDSYHIDRIKRIGCPNVHLLPCAYNPALFHPVELSDEDMEYFGSDVSFIGTPYTDRGRILVDLKEFKLKIWGGKWRNLQLVRRTVIDSTVDIPTCLKIICASKINLVLPQIQSVHGYNQFLFEVLGTGGFCVTRGLKDLNEYKLLEGEDIVTFTDINDLKDKIKYYLENPDERDKILQNGLRKVKNFNTFTHRAQTILKEVGL